jgi:hypothetical protein
MKQYFDLKSLTEVGFKFQFGAAIEKEISSSLQV